MSEAQSRPYGSRGRGSYRGGRGGYRGARNGSKVHMKTDDQENLPPASPEEQGEVGELKKVFGNKVSSLREVCSGWSDEDLVYALQETNGDVDVAFDRISSGSISQWGEVGKKKQPKTKDGPSSASESTIGSRIGRGRGTSESRGRGRGTDRGRGSRIGRGASQSNGTKSSDKPTTTASDGWGDTAPVTETTGNWDSTGNTSNTAWDAAPAMETAAAGDWANESVKDGNAQSHAEDQKGHALPSTVKPGGWAGLFAKPPAPRKAPASVPVAQAEELSPFLASLQGETTEGLPPPIETPVIEDSPSELPEAPHSDTPTMLTPSKDELTESNLEQLPDSSQPLASATAASTVASTQDPLAFQSATVRPGLSMSGHSLLAQKAMGGAQRTASYNRRILEQNEPVVMPGNHAVDRAAVQFGSMGLNGLADDADVDEEREEPETRTQLPDDSPAAPRASLPPIHHEVDAPAPVQAIPEAPQAQRQAPGLPPIQQSMAQPSSPPSASSYTDQYRYGQPAPKHFDPFGHQSQAPQAQQSQAQSQEPFSNQIPTHSQQQLSSGQNEYPNYYGAPGRDPYQNYYGNYGQSQETQQRSGSAFGTSAQDAQAQYATSRPQQGYGQQEAQNSGHNTPNPSIPGHQSQHSQHLPQTQPGPSGYQYGYPGYGQQYPQYGGYGVNHRYGANRPAFDDVRRQDTDYYASQNQYGYGQNQQYGGSYNKASMYSQPQQQYSYEHSASPANTSGYGQSVAGREALYGRTGSAQPSEAQQPSTTPFVGGLGDPFGRTHSGFGHQQQTSGEDPSKVYEATKASGPSPAIGQSNRPGSAINNVQGQQSSQSSSFPPSQSQHSAQQGYGGYPQYGGTFGGTHQGQSNHPQTAGYGGHYGSNTAFGSTYGGYGGGRGWNGNNYGGGH